MKDKIFIRVDGNLKIGLGHVYRCLSLAIMLKSDFDISFFLCNSDNSVNELIKNSSFTTVIIEEDEFFFNYLNDCKIVVLDGYHFGTNYQNMIRSVGVKCVCIDDIYNENFVADLIINYAPYVAPSDYENKIESHTRLALGVEYILLRPSFFQVRHDQKDKTNSPTLFICFGGSDINNLTIDTLDVALSFKEFNKFIVVTGASYRNSIELKKRIEIDNRIIHYHSIDEKNMTDIMCQSDLAIIPASSILYEILSCGVTPLLTYFAENQKMLHDFMVEEYSIVTFGNSGISIDKKKLKKEIADYIKRPSGSVTPIFYQQFNSASNNILNQFHAITNNKRFIFDNGKIEFVNFTQLSNQEHEMIINWRNDEKISKWMKSDSKIHIADHFRFVKNLNESNTDFYWLIYRKKIPCGVVYINKLNSELKTAEWGLYLGVNFIGTGIGLEISFYALKVFFNFLNIIEVFGIIKNNNLENQKLQKILGFDFHNLVNIENEEYIVTSLTKNKYNKFPVNFPNYQKNVLWKKK